MPALSKEPVASIDLEIRVSTPWGQGGQRIDYVVHSPAGTAGFHEERVEGQHLHSPETFQQQLLDQLDRLDAGRDTGGKPIPPDEVLRELKSIGHDLYQALFPRQMRAIYREVAGQVRTLLLTSDEPWIPWEILRPCEHEDDDFLCMRFQMSRWLSGDVPLSFEKEVRQMLLIEAGGGQALESASRETRALEELAAQTPGLEKTLRRDVRLQEVVELLEAAEFDLLHLTGHGAHDPRRPAEASVALPDRALRARHLFPEAEKKLRLRRPVVFFNSCQVGRLSTSLTSVDGWANRWVRRCGCTAFLAPIWSVEDGRAARFAEVVYGNLYCGQSLGEAVRFARHALRDEDPADVTWLAYSLYGAPTARIHFGDHHAEAREATGFTHSDMPLGAPLLAIGPHPARGNDLDAAEHAGRVRPHLRLLGPFVGAGVVLVAAGILAKTGPWWLGSGDGSGARLGGEPAEETATKSDGPVAQAAGGLEERGPVGGQPASVAKATSDSSLPAVASPPPFPLQVVTPGRLGIIVLDRQTGLPDRAVSGALRATLAIRVPGIDPFIPELQADWAVRLVEGDLSDFPGQGGAPWGAEYLLLAAASRQALPKPSPHLEGQSLTLDAQLIDTRRKSTLARSRETHTGVSTSADGALDQAAERCLAPITATLIGGDTHGDSN